MDLIFRFIKNTLLWKQTFDAEFRSGKFMFPKLNARLLDEKMYFWREQAGRRNGMPPGEAVFHAFEDFANSYFKENRGRPNSEVEFEDIAAGLEQAAPYVDRYGRYRDRKSFLDERWLSYLEAYQRRYVYEKELRQSQLQEVTGLRISRVEIDAAWKSLIDGDVSPAARSVWSALKVRSSAHDVSDKAMMSLKNTMFFLIVFRDHHIVTEAFVGDRHLYSQNIPFDRAKLQEPLASLIIRLSA